MVGFEPTTPALRKRCSAVELHRRPPGLLNCSYAVWGCQFRQETAVQRRNRPSKTSEVRNTINFVFRTPVRQYRRYVIEKPVAAAGISYLSLSLSLSLSSSSLSFFSSFASGFSAAFLAAGLVSLDKVSLGRMKS